MIRNWDAYNDFNEAEFICSYTGLCDMQPAFMDKLQNLRNMYAAPMIITSGFRHPTHPIEARKKTGPGWHARGKAADIACDVYEAHRLVKLAFEMGFGGIGVSQNGENGRFVHLDTRDTKPVLYSY